MTTSNSRRSPLWLNLKAGGDNSQFGEDGIIATILDLLPHRDNWCVEFGAWDGKHLSNTYSLIRERGYSAVLIEGEGARVEKLRRNFQANSKVHPIHASVGWSSEDGLDSILATTPIPLEFDLASIDIDGNDFHAWDAVRTYRPKVVVIEFNPSIPNLIDFVQRADSRINYGSSLRALVRLGDEKGYQLVATTQANAFFVCQEYFDACEIFDNSIDTLHADQPWVTYLFFGYDGSAHLTGRRVVPWHVVPLTDRQVQVIPRVLRRFPPTFGIARRWILRVYQLWTRLLRGSPRRPA